jgi:hypothetical protein
LTGASIDSGELRDRGCHVRGTDRPEQLALVRGTSSDDNTTPGQGLGQGVGAGAFSQQRLFVGGTQRLSLAQSAFGGLDRVRLRHQVVPAVPVGNVDDISFGSEVGHIFGEDEFHHRYLVSE